MERLRIVAVGNVDDGKSTLLGRLLYDSKALFTDHLREIESASAKRGTKLDLAFVTDGLKSEREQGITIDVAYRFFSTPKRKFVVIDAPGHFHYTRNMLTGASNADVGLVLVDATQGVQEQTKRHLYLLSLLRVPHVVVCVSKMDLVGYSADAFHEIRDSFSSLLSGLHFETLRFIPVSSLHGENIVQTSSKMSWSSEPALLEILETIPARSLNDGAFRFPVQYVLGKSYAGMVMRGEAQVGNEVTVLPGGQKFSIRAMHRYPDRILRCAQGESVALELEGDPVLERGAMICSEAEMPLLASEFKATACWFAENSLERGTRLFIRHGTRELGCEITEVEDQLDVDTLTRKKNPGALSVNDIGSIRLRTEDPIAFDLYSQSRQTGSAILIDPATRSTVAALMLER
jgi:sulfate adenylyltransferase large subunit